jgi:hypothetical protein
MRILVTAVTLMSAATAVLVAIDVLVLLLRMHAPFTATGEALLFVGTFGRRKPRFIGQPWKSSFRGNSGQIGSMLFASSLGALFWLLVVGALLYAAGPLPQVHEW